MHEYRCTIRRVVDGDTVDVDIDLGFGIWVRNERVRLHGIDTPESRTRDLEEKKCGIYAKQCVEAFMPVDSTQVLKTHKDKVGKYGRVLGEFVIYDPDEDRQTTINEYMIRNKIGVAYSGKSKDDIKQEHLDNRKSLYESGKIK